MPTYFLLIIFTFLSLFSLGAAKEYECEENEIIINERIYGKNILNQGKTGTCVGHSLAQVYTALLPQSNNKELDVSPLFISLHSKVKGSYRNYRDRLIENGKFEKVEIKQQRLRKGHFLTFFEDFKNAPICSPKSVEYFLFEFTKTTTKDEALDKTFEFLSFVENHDKRITLYDINKLNLDLIHANTFLKFLREKNLLPNLEKKKKFFFQKNKHKNKIAYRYLDILYDFLVDQCQKNEEQKENILSRFKIEQFSVHDYSKEEIIAKIDENITSTMSHPIELSYRPRNLYIEGNEEGAHSSIIIGRGCFEHKKYYIIRNSWGGVPFYKVPEQPDNYNTYRGDFAITSEEMKIVWTEDLGSIKIIKEIKPEES